MHVCTRTVKGGALGVNPLSQGRRRMEEDVPCANDV